MSTTIISLQDGHSPQDGPVSVGMRCNSNSVALSLCVASEPADVPPDTPPRVSAWGRCTPQPKASSFLDIARKAEHISPPKPEPVVMPPPAIAPLTPTQPAPRVLTGDAVTRQYQDARSTARDLARLRNMCFMQATQAYLAGNKALAKELGARGVTGVLFGCCHVCHIEYTTQDAPTMMR